MMGFYFKTLFCLKDPSQYPPGSERTEALNRMCSFLKEWHVQGKVKDSLALDRDKVITTASSLCSRWKNIRMKADNLFNIGEEV